MGYETAASIISDVAVEVGLSDPGADPVASTDDNVKQLVRLLTAAGRAILRDYTWSQFRKQAEVTLEDGIATYSLPSDFRRVIDQTAWDRTSDLPLGGPVSSQQWQALQAQSAGGVVDTYFRVLGGDIQVTPTPTSTRSVFLEYVSNYWVAATGNAAPTADRVSASTDVVWLDPYLVSRKVRVLFLEAKGFDSSAARADYERAWDAAVSADSAAPVLSLSQRAAGFGRLLDSVNVPDTGFGGV
jgi:hypothetical protein